jgi:hypothetical protein
VADGSSYGGKVQVSRLGNPLVNEVVVPAGLKDTFNATKPEQDAKIPALVKRVTNPEVPQLLQQIYQIPAPATPRNDLVEIFLTGITTKAGGPIKADLNSQLNNADVKAGRFTPSEQLRLNLSVPVAGQPNRLGVLAGDLQGFPNGRRLTDDVVDIELQALAGAAQTGKLVDALATGDRVDANNQQFGDRFPYVALPNGVGVNTQGGAAAPATAPAVATVPPSAAIGDAGIPDAGIPDTAVPVAAPLTAPAGSSWKTKPVAYATGATGLGALILAFGLFAFMRRRRATQLVPVALENDKTTRL